MSGDTSAGGLRRVEGAIAGHVRVLIVALGVNDGLRGIPVLQVKANLGGIVTAARTRGIPVLLCAMEALPIYGWDYTEAFHRMYLELARQYSVPLVPFVLASILGDLTMMQPDRVHPNAAGARAIAQQIWPYLEAMLKASAP